MPVTIATVLGSINKDINSIHILPVQGSTWKEVASGYVASVQGAINKEFYANWQYLTGSISRGAWANNLILYGDTEQVRSLVNAIAPVSIQLSGRFGNPTLETSFSIRYRVEHSMDGINYTSLATQLESFTPYTTRTEVNTFTMDGNTLVKYIRYTLQLYNTLPGVGVNLYASTGNTWGEVVSWWGRP